MARAEPSAACRALPAAAATEKGDGLKNETLIAEASTTIDAPVNAVWKALVTPAIIRKYMFGTEVKSDWTEGGAITWKGEWKGKEYEDKGEILKIEPNRLLRYSHFSPLAGLPDTAENYHTVEITLSDQGNSTGVKLTQDDNATEEAREHSAKNWQTMLDGLKKVLEEAPPS